MIKYCFLVYFLVFVSLFLGCSDDPEIVQEEMEDVMTDNGNEIVSISGLIEKGPYLIGSTVTMNELNSNFGPTGRVFSTQIEDDRGLFRLNNISLEENYVSLTANGFYYDEIAGDNSTAQLNLHGIADIRDNQQLNVNMLTTLEKNRVEFLLSSGLDFDEAKHQAQSEVFQLFEMDEESTVSESISISEEGDANSKLLALSVIVQGFLPIADISELISKLSFDLQEDGDIDDISLGEQLAFNASRLNLEIIRANLENRYASISDLPFRIPAFEEYIRSFLANTPFEVKSNILYPEFGATGKNILHPNFATTRLGDHSMTAVLSEGNTLKVKIYGNNWVYPAFQEGSGWTSSDFDREEKSRIFTSNRYGELDFEIRFQQHSPEGPISNKVKIEIFENDSQIPTITKIVILEDANNSISYAHHTDIGSNLLGYFDDLYDEGTHGMQAYLNGEFSIKAVIKGEYWAFVEGSENGWKVTDSADDSMTFESEPNVESAYLQIELLEIPMTDPYDHGPYIYATIDVYENGATTPTYTKELSGY